MKKTAHIIAPVFALCLTGLAGLAGPAAAQDQDPQSGESMSEGFNLMEEGAKMLFREFMKEMDPALSEFEDLAKQMAPMLLELSEEMAEGLIALSQKIDDFSHYEAPEVLPNGDIIIRRKPQAPEYQEPPQDGIEL